MERTLRTLAGGQDWGTGVINVPPGGQEVVSILHGGRGVAIDQTKISFNSNVGLRLWPWGKDS